MSERSERESSSALRQFARWEKAVVVSIVGLSITIASIAWKGGETLANFDARIASLEAASRASTTVTDGARLAALEARQNVDDLHYRELNAHLERIERKLDQLIYDGNGRKTPAGRVESSP